MNHETRNHKKAWNKVTVQVEKNVKNAQQIKDDLNQQTLVCKKCLYMCAYDCAIVVHNTVLTISSNL